jgi:hypothetical protein
MKKLIVGVVAVGAVLALRPVVKRRIVQKMHEHCKQMAAKCKQMMAARSTDHEEATGKPEHCKEMAAQFNAHGEPAETREQPEPETAQSVGSGEAVAV